MEGGRSVGKIYQIKFNSMWNVFECQKTNQICFNSLFFRTRSSEFSIEEKLYHNYYVASEQEMSFENSDKVGKREKERGV